MQKIEQIAGIALIATRVQASASRVNRGTAQLIMTADPIHQGDMRRFLRREAWVLLKLSIRLWWRTWR